MRYLKTAPLMSVMGILAFASSANAAAVLSWNGSNAIVDNALSITTLYETTAPGGATYGRLTWDPLEATSPGIGVDNITQPNSPPGATGCILAGGALCDDPRQSGKRFKLQATAPGPIDLIFDYADDGSSIGDTPSPSAPVNGLYRIFGKVINAMQNGLVGYTLELGTGVGDGFSQLTGNEGVTFYEPQNTPPRNFELASIFPAGLFSPAGEPLPTSDEGFFSGDRSGFNMAFSPTMIETAGIFGDYVSFFGDAVLPLSQVPEGFFFDDDMDPSTEDVLQAWFDDSAGAWLFGQANGFAPVDAATLAAWELDPLFYTGEIEDLANNNLNASILFDDAAAGQFTLRVTPSAAQVPAPAGILLIGSVVACVTGFAAIRRRIGASA